MGNCRINKRMVALREHKQGAQGAQLGWPLGTPFPGRQGTGLLPPSLWAAYGPGLGKGGQRWLSHRAWGQNKVRLELEPEPSLPIARSLRSDRAVWRSSHLSFCFWTQPQQMASCRQRTQAEGSSAGMRIYQLLFAKPLEAAARSVDKRARV